MAREVGVVWMDNVIERGGPEIDFGGIRIE